MIYFKILQNLPPEKEDPSCPVTVLSAAVLENQVDPETLFRLSVYNVSEETVTGMEIRILPFTESGDALPEVFYSYTDFTLLPGEDYGRKIPVKLPEHTKSVEFHLLSVSCMDGKWTPGNAFLLTPPLEKLPLREDFIETLLAPVGGNREAKYFYSENEEAWRCVCGKINEEKDQECSRCHLNRAILSSDFTKEAVAVRADEFEKDKRQREKEKIEFLRLANAQREQAAISEKKAEEPVPKKSGAKLWVVIACSLAAILVAGFILGKIFSWI